MLNVAINYGGRNEIVAAVRDLAARGVDLTELDNQTLSGALYTAGLPDPDLIIRTAGEMRISNFMLWQTAYAEIYVTKTLWPDFGPADIERAFAAYARRDRRFGAVPPRVEEALRAPVTL
jgi:undecaprenyl diphosphate synthase